MIFLVACARWKLDSVSDGKASSVALVKKCEKKCTFAGKELENSAKLSGLLAAPPDDTRWAWLLKKRFGRQFSRMKMHLA